MAQINSNFDKLTSSYLFPEISRRTDDFLKNNKNTKIMRLGIGDTTMPLPKTIIKGLHKAVDYLSDEKTYTGYGDDQGNIELRKALINKYSTLNVDLDISEIFISDGAKSDSANIQQIFSNNSIIAVQDPAYPVYVDSNVIGGKTGNWENDRYNRIYYMPCTQENSFFPELPKSKVDLIYLCSPNNPTGKVATKNELESFVNYAIDQKAVIIFDAAYASFIKDNSLPKSIFEIKNADKCSIEINSFSKFAGFTGVRLGWTIVPENLVIENTEKNQLRKIWKRRQSTMFNSASNIAQAGGLTALSEEGQKECKEIIDYYMENASIIKSSLEEIGLICFGGDNAPYIWMKTPNKMKSWDFFNKLLEETYVVGTPGVGFGPSGEGYFRLSSFGKREDILNATQSIKKNLKI